ncbi:MBL fold metallo-hydrolase [Acetivibrio cellulolyticus]|uniref:MBL fold metallo-hydrolase n=1 Tax=Acetivibrio cellulolyticus TaxID=35830 RepID=UPI0001E2C22D|nr:MBL fold metallo-hydrolase [Acetivibrio cellulolyticus]
MKIHFIRHATMIIYYNNVKILVDPVLSPKNTISAVINVPNKKDNPLKDLPVSMDSIVDCDAVFVTHTHRDHFDDAAIKFLPKNITLFCQPKDEVKIKKFGFTNVIPVKDNFEWRNIKINRTKGKHGHFITALKMAPVSGFVISAPSEPVVYLTGDTIWCSHTKKTIEKYHPEIIVSNCGEARFARGKAITMDAEDILSICKKTPEAKVVAVHMDAWNHCRLSKEDLRNFKTKHSLNGQIFIPEEGECMSFI